MAYVVTWLQYAEGHVCCRRPVDFCWVVQKVKVRIADEVEYICLFDHKTMPSGLLLSPIRVSFASEQKRHRCLYRETRTLTLLLAIECSATQPGRLTLISKKAGLNLLIISSFSSIL